MLFKFKFCDSCYIFRPLRTSHCNICNNCMLKYDHHCVWLGSCVAKRNYNLFYWFVFHLTLMIVLITWLCGLNVLVHYRESEDYGYTLKAHWPSVVVAAVAILFSTFVFALLGFHSYIISEGLTT